MPSSRVHPQLCGSPRGNSAAGRCSMRYFLQSNGGNDSSALGILAPAAGGKAVAAMDQGHGLVAQQFIQCNGASLRHRQGRLPVDRLRQCPKGMPIKFGKVDPIAYRRYKRHVAQVARSGDTLIVWKLDRLARSMKQLIDTIETLRVRGIGFRSLTESSTRRPREGRVDLKPTFGVLMPADRSVHPRRSFAQRYSAVHANLSSSVFAFFRSAVSNPSVNQA